MNRPWFTDESVLCLNEDKKKTRSWFQGLRQLSVPLDGIKYGLIRTIAYQGENVKTLAADTGRDSKILYDINASVYIM